MITLDVRHFYILFIIVNLVYNNESKANFSFSDNLHSTPTKIQRTRPQTELESHLHQCTVDLCNSFDSTKTFKFYSEQAALNTATSTFFEDSIFPLIMNERNKGLILLEEAEDFVKALNSLKSDVKLTQEQRKTIALVDGLKMLKPPTLPVMENLVEVGPINSPMDFGYYFGDEFDHKRFDSLVARGLYKEREKDILKAFIENRNLEFLSPFLVDSKAQFSSLVNVHGKGARTLIDMAYSQYIDFYRDPMQKDPLLKYLVPYQMLEYKRRFVLDHFDLLVKMQNISNYEYDFTTSIASLGIFKEFARTVSPFIDPDKLGTPHTVSKNEIAEVSDLVSKRLKGQRESVESVTFAERISNQCRWKINYLYQGLPTDEELIIAQQQVTEAIVQFQVWMFENLSSETATSVFDFLRSWEFFFPPSKNEYSDFLKGFIELDRKNWVFSNDPNAIPILVKGILSVDQIPKTYHGLEKIEEFCQKLNIDPIGDNADSQAAQVYLGWMTLKDKRLLETVVWHELAHIVASLLQGENKWNMAQFLNGQKQNFSISVESFTKFMTTRQCLGTNQTQKISFANLGEPYLTWFNEGYFEQFKGKDSSHEHFDLPNNTFRAGDMGIYKMRVGRMIRQEREEHLDLGEKELLNYINGEFIDEDWADLISSIIAKEKNNPFCFMLKDQDHLFWNEKKGKTNDEIPEIRYMEENFRKYEEMVPTTPRKEFTEKDRDFYNAHTPKHSTLFYRFLHAETVRSGYLPPSCQRAKMLNPNFSQIKKCDYF